MKLFALCLISLTLLSFHSQAEVVRSQITSAIEAREPVDDLANTVAIPEDDVQSVIFFTHLKGFADKQIVHRWYYNGREMAAITLNIGSNNWRTYSSKKIMAGWTGAWQVQVWHQDLQLLSHDFNVTN